MKQLFCFSYFAFCMSFSYEALAQEERATPKAVRGYLVFYSVTGVPEKRTIRSSWN